MAKKKDHVLYVFHGLMKWVVSDSFESGRVAWIMFDFESNHFSEFSWKLVFKPTGKVLRFYSSKNKYKQPVPARTEFYSDVYWKGYKGGRYKSTKPVKVVTPA